MMDPHWRQRGIDGADNTAIGVIAHAAHGPDSQRITDHRDDRFRILIRRAHFDLGCKTSWASGESLVVTSMRCLPPSSDPGLRLPDHYTAIGGPRSGNGSLDVANTIGDVLIAVARGFAYHPNVAQDKQAISF